MWTKRSKMEILYDMLRVIQKKRGGIRPTHLMYKANLSSKLLTQYVARLLKKRLITVKRVKLEKKGKRDTKMIEITMKGTKLLASMKADNALYYAKILEGK